MYSAEHKELLLISQQGWGAREFQKDSIAQKWAEKKGKEEHKGAHRKTNSKRTILTWISKITRDAFGLNNSKGRYQIGQNETPNYMLATETQRG